MEIPVLDLKLEAKILGDLLGAGIQPNAGLGTSHEFTQYRKYEPGDHPRLVDWKKYTQTKQKWVKQGQQEKNIEVYFVIDQSASMNFIENGINRAYMAHRILGALGYLTYKQGDTLHLIKWNQDSAWVYKNLKTYNAFLGRINENSSEKSTRLLKYIPKKSIVIIISDFLDETTQMFQYLDHLKAQNNDVRLYQILGKTETDFSMENTAGLVDIENEKRIFSVDNSTRSYYIKAFYEHQKILENKVLSLGFLLFKYTLGEDLVGFLRRSLK